MATRAEQFRSDEQRTKKGGRASVKKPRKATWSKEKEHAKVKASHALERTGRGRPSRKSTRAGANRIKPDAVLNVSQEARRGAPEVTARKARARSRRVRGSS